jgi:hypothetical protein
MPTARGRQTVTPVVVEVKPSDVGASDYSTTSPSSPSKKARFARKPVDGITRPLTSIEEWSLYNFEIHARNCRDCYAPLEVHLKGGRLCNEGHALAQDVACHVYDLDGEVYSKSRDGHKLVRVELQPGYNNVRSLLKAMDRGIRTTSRTVPIISYDRTYPVPPRRRSSPEPREKERMKRYDDEDGKEAVIEPASSTKPQRRSSHRPKRYNTVIVEDDVQAQPSQEPEKKSSSRKGSLYDADMQRQKRDRGYVVEIREPRYREVDRSRKEERRRSGFYS